MSRVVAQFRAGLVAFGVAVVLCAGSVRAEVAEVGATTQATSEIRRAKAVDDGNGVAVAAKSNPIYETARVVGSLAAVIAVIVGLKFAAGKMLGLKGAGANANKGVRVLSRTMMGPKQQLVLLQVGRRLVLVADSAGKVATVCEISDPDEVAELSAQALGTNEGIGGGKSKVSFPQVFRGRSEQFEEMEEEEDELYESPAELADRRGQDDVSGERELEGLAKRVRALGQQFSPPSS